MTGHGAGGLATVAGLIAVVGVGVPQLLPGGGAAAFAGLGGGAGGGSVGVGMCVLTIRRHRNGKQFRTIFRFDGDGGGTFTGGGYLTGSGYTRHLAVGGGKG